MDFREATDRLMEAGFTAAEIGHALNLAPQTVRVMRMDPSSPHYRTPPVDWPDRLASLTRDRGGSLQQLADDLERVKAPHSKGGAR